MTDSTAPAATDDELRDILRTMIAARVYSTRAFNLQRQGRSGTMAPIDGAEALVVGTASALDPSIDWVFPQYREPVALGRFGDEVIDTHMLYLMGHPAGGSCPHPVRVFPTQISLAAQLPHAVGMAWGMQLRGEAGVAAVFCGDGSTSEGDFYEAANFAGVLRAPVLFMINNNGWAISTPLSKQTAAASFADKAVAAGFPGVQVDGRDPIAVREVVAAARIRAVAGEGPTLIECISYRLGPHTTADDPTRYVPADILALEQAKDPVAVFGGRLRQLGLWTDADEEAALATAAARIDLAVERAESTPLAPDAFFDHVFATGTTDRMERQRATLLAIHAESEGA